MGCSGCGMWDVAEMWDVNLQNEKKNSIGSSKKVRAQVFPFEGSACFYVRSTENFKRFQ